MQFHWTYKWEILNKLILRIVIILFNDMINIEDFDSSLVKKDKKSCKNIGICNIGYITIKNISDYESINCVNPLYLIIDKVDGYIEEKYGNKNLTFASTDENKKVQKSTKNFRIRLKTKLNTITWKKVGIKKISWKSNLIQMIIYL